MKAIPAGDICTYVNENIISFHDAKLKSLEKLKLDTLIKKNPYLFKAKNIQTASEMIGGLLDAFLSSSEEKLFGDFLEGLALFIAGQTSQGHKSAAQGIDLEFFNNDIHYVVSIKSGPNWGNSSQQDKLEQDFKNVVKRIKQSNQNINVQPVLGICYGKTKTSYLRGYMKIVGQNFWYLISENKDLYTDIIEPIGYKARDHNENFIQKKNNITNRFTKEFIDRFCFSDGAINWNELVKSNSGNYSEA
ncbi:MAG: cytosolic protein [Dehalococcoidales bacterium]|nr:cytosolic protein [Dehalococcoidales bacterium]